MTASRRDPFRPLADDPAPGAELPDLTRRLGWVLQTARLHHDDPSYSDAAGFAGALTRHGHPSTAQDVELWETAARQPTYAVVEAWERACDLPDGTLTSAYGCIRAALPGTFVPEIRPELDPAADSSKAERDGLLARLAAGTLDARGWASLGWHLAAEPEVVTAERGDALAGALVRGLTRSTGVAFRDLSTAAVSLAGVPAVHDALPGQVRGYLAEGGRLAVPSAVGLLDLVRSHEASAVVLELFERPLAGDFHLVSVWVATQKLMRGDFDEAERARLQVAVLARWRSHGTRVARDLAGLIGVLPEGLRVALGRAALHSGEDWLGDALAHGEDAPGRAEEVAAQVAAAARARVPDHGGYDGNAMLARLVREALFHAQHQRRHLAALLLQASRFAHPVADALLALLQEEDEEPLVRERTAYLTSYLAGEEHRMRLHHLLDDRPEVAVLAVASLGHLPFSATTDLALRRTLLPEPSRAGYARLYALGMTGSPGLAAIAGSASHPSWQRKAAAWWLRSGPALT